MNVGEIPTGSVCPFFEGMDTEVAELGRIVGRSHRKYPLGREEKKER